MGRIIRNVKVQNTMNPDKEINFTGLIDTGAMYVTLPNEWRELLGDIPVIESVQCATADGKAISGDVVGPVTITVEGFRPVYNEVLFIDMQTNEDENHEPLIGHLVLQNLNVAVDMLGHRLVHAKYIDLK